jgi:hypothetical protein
VDHFGLTMGEIARLTDRQILDIYYHKRDKETGAIEPPPVEADASRPPTLESELFALRQLAAALNMKPDNVAECEAKLKEKYARE